MNARERGELDHEGLGAQGRQGERVQRYGDIGVEVDKEFQFGPLVMEWECGADKGWSL